MKCEALAVLLLFHIKTAAEVRSAQISGEIVDVFVESFYLSTEHSSLDPDTYVKVSGPSLFFMQFEDFFFFFQCSQTLWNIFWSADENAFSVLLCQILTTKQFLNIPIYATQLTVGDKTSATRVVEKNKYATFNEWFSFRKVLSEQLDVEVWDRDDSPAREDVLVGRCSIKLNKDVSEDKCFFDGGQVSLIYVCT